MRGYAAQAVSSWWNDWGDPACFRKAEGKSGSFRHKPTQTSKLLSWTPIPWSQQLQQRQHQLGQEMTKTPYQTSTTCRQRTLMRCRAPGSEGSAIVMPGRCKRDVWQAAALPLCRRQCRCHAAPWLSHAAYSTLVLMHAKRRRAAVPIPESANFGLCSHDARALRSMAETCHRLSADQWYPHQQPHGSPKRPSPRSCSRRWCTRLMHSICCPAGGSAAALSVGGRAGG